MPFYTKDPKRQQSARGKHWPDRTWLAYIDANVQDEVVIEQAKQIVAHCSPQRYGPHGTQAYSFLQLMLIMACFQLSIFVLLMNGFIATQSLQNQSQGGIAFGHARRDGFIIPGGGLRLRP